MIDRELKGGDTWSFIMGKKKIAIVPRVVLRLGCDCSSLDSEPSAGERFDCAWFYT